MEAVPAHLATIVEDPSQVRHADLSDEDQVFVATHGSSIHHLHLVRRKDTSQDAFKAILTSERATTMVLSELVSTVGLSEENQLVVVETLNSILKRLLASGPSLSEEVAERLRLLGDVEVLNSLAENPATPWIVQERILEGVKPDLASEIWKSPVIRFLCMNRGLAPSVQSEIFRLGSSSILEALAVNHALTPELQWGILERGKTSEPLLPAKLTLNRNLLPEVQALLVQMGEDVQVALAKNSNLTLEAQVPLSYGTPDVVRALIGNLAFQPSREMALSFLRTRSKFYLDSREWLDKQVPNSAREDLDALSNWKGSLKSALEACTLMRR